MHVTHVAIVGRVSGCGCKTIRRGVLQSGCARGVVYRTVYRHGTPGIHSVWKL